MRSLILVIGLSGLAVLLLGGCTQETSIIGPDCTASASASGGAGGAADPSTGAAGGGAPGDASSQAGCSGAKFATK